MEIGGWILSLKIQSLPKVAAIERDSDGVETLLGCAIYRSPQAFMPSTTETIFAGANIGWTNGTTGLGIPSNTRLTSCSRAQQCPHSEARGCCRCTRPSGRSQPRTWLLLRARFNRRETAGLVMLSAPTPEFCLSRRIDRLQNGQRKSSKNASMPLAFDYQ